MKGNIQHQTEQRRNSGTIRIIALFLIIALTFCGCSKKEGIEKIIDFTSDDISYISVMISTPEESGGISISDQEGIDEAIDLLKTIKLQKKLDDTESGEPTYYDYTIYFSNEKSFRIIDYQDKVKIIDAKGNESWYEITANTWERLTTIWKKYYVEPTGSVIQNQNVGEILCKKPVIYLYPTKATEVFVKLELGGTLTYTYPQYQNGWQVLANKDGTLKNIRDGKTYSYLFWEGLSDATFDMSKGFVVKGEDTTMFLEEKLSYLGLTNKEYNDFIVYWAPKMSENHYNLITFQGTAYTDSAKLSITPEPDSIQRVFMVYQPLENYIDIPEQELDQWERTGFSVIEWGGAEVYK